MRAKPPHISQNLETMVELTITVPDGMVQTIEDLIKWMPEVEITKSITIQDANDRYDQCFKEAINSLNSNKVIKRPRDYAWIMAGLEQDMDNDMPCFSSTRGFRGYLYIIGVRPLPSNTALHNALKLVDGIYPDWEFLDEPDMSEKRRRKEVFQLFMIAFKRALKSRVND